jgi:hypothetical protein
VAKIGRGIEQRAIEIEPDQIKGKIRHCSPHVARPHSPPAAAAPPAMVAAICAVHSGATRDRASRTGVQPAQPADRRLTFLQKCALCWQTVAAFWKLQENAGNRGA